MNLTNIKQAIKPHLYNNLLPLASFLYRTYMRLQCRFTELTEGGGAAEGTGLTQIQPARLRYRVHGTPKLGSFIEVGRATSGTIESALEKHGHPIGLMKNVLDFGCGCGRTLMWYKEKAGTTSFYGTDIDSEAIAWCKDNIGFAEFGVNGALPPLGYASSMFDLVYAISVFTHLDEDYQFKWLDELARVTRPGGMVLVTVHGVRTHSGLPPSRQAELKNKGFLYITTNVTKSIFPAWYQTAYHTEEYVRDRFSKHFNVVEYAPGGMNGYQDMALMQRHGNTEDGRMA